MSALPRPQTQHLTIEVEDNIAQRFKEAANERGVSLSELMVGFTEWELTQQDWAAQEPYTPEQIAQMEVAIAQIERGETVPHEDVFARLKERFPDQTGREIIEAALASYAELLTYVADLPILNEDADALMAKGIADMEAGRERKQAEVFADWRAKYG